MPTPADILSLQDDDDPEDQLRMQLSQGQGNNLAGAPMPPGQGGMQPPGQGAPVMAPSPNVPGPLSALAKMKPKVRAKIKVQPPPLRKTPRSKPHIKLKSQPTSPLQGFLDSLGN